MYKIQNKLLLFVLAFTVFLFAVILAFNTVYLERKTQAVELENKLYKLENDLLVSFNDINTLLLKSLNDSSVSFAENNIKLLQLRKKVPVLNKEFHGLNTVFKNLKKENEGDLPLIIESYQSYIAYLNEIIDLLKTRCNPNNGLVARINQTEKEIGRLHCNKDILYDLKVNSQLYQLFKNPKYIENINLAAKKIDLQMQKESTLPSPEKKKITGLINNYIYLFRDLQDVDVKLDIRVKSSYFNKLMSEKNRVLGLFDKTYKHINVYQATLDKNRVIFYILLFITYILSSLIFSAFLTRTVSPPIKWLTGNITKILYNKEGLENETNRYGSYKEIDDLYRKILVLLQYLKDQEGKRQAAQVELINSEKRYRELADMLPQSIYETDNVGKITYANKAWFKIFGFSVEDIAKGTSIIETIVSESGEPVMGNHRFVHSDFIGIRKDGTTFPAVVYSNQVIKNGKMTGIRGIVIDNTERRKYIELLKKEKERAEQLDKQKTSYLADMSHELRTPMNAILGFADLLASLELNKSQKEEFITHINHSSQHVLHLIDDIIDLAKIEAGELHIEKTEVDINKLMQEVYTPCEGLLKRSGKHNAIVLKLNIPSGPLICETDPFRLKQILNNLLGNAIKFTEKGKIEYGYFINDNSKMQFYVSDSGMGMSEDDTQMIFERYRQLGPGAVAQGKGLGLAISKRIIEIMGGKIWARSNKGEGTEFSFVLPVLKYTEKVNRIIEEPCDFTYNWGNKLVLVAEDEDLNYKVVKEYLRRTGARVIRAYDGQEAVELCRTNNKIDMVLMDIKMPVMDGYLATAEIKSFKPGLPVVALTAYALSDEKQRCIDSGCDEYIAKPYTKEHFLKKLDLFLTEEIKNA